MKLTVRQLKQLIKEQVEEVKAPWVQYKDPNKPRYENPNQGLIDRPIKQRKDILKAMARELKRSHNQQQELTEADILEMLKGVLEQVISDF